MIYATVSDMQRRFQRVELDLITARRTDNGEPDDSLIQDALNDAGAMIESYISPRYTLPLSVVPPTLARQCCVIAWYFLCDQRATEQATLNYKDAIKWLADVRDNKIPLGVDETGTAPASEDLAQIVSDTPVFSRKQRGFI
jgi:phage gp36-like protein